MGNKIAVKYFEDLSNTAIDITSTKLNKFNDFSSFDANFILRYTSKDSNVLDLASGTGITINKYFDKVGHITAVEKFKNFTKFIVNAPNVKIYNEDICKFKTNNKFDVIIFFGIMHYFNEEETIEIYKKYKSYLSKNGLILIKQQFGVNEDVKINGYSKELNCNYYSEYRHIDKEVNILENVGFKNIDVIDIYPPECNRWDNTHFYAIVGKVKN